MEIIKIKPAFTDERGNIWDFLTDQEINHIGFLESKANSVRGKHYHKEQKQYTLVLNGRVKITGKNLLDNNSDIEEVELGKMEMVVFPPYYYHAIKTLEDSECLVFTSKSRKDSRYEEDTVRIADLESFKLPE